MIRRGNDLVLYPPTSPYSQVVSDGDYLFLSGVVAADIPGGEVVVGDIRGETRLVLAAIADLLRRHGASLERVVRVDVHLRDLEEMAIMDQVYRRFFRHQLPARTCTGNATLYGDCRVEITVMARQRFSRPRVGGV